MLGRGSGPSSSLCSGRAPGRLFGSALHAFDQTCLTFEPLDSSKTTNETHFPSKALQSPDAGGGRRRRMRERSKCSLGGKTTTAAAAPRNTQNNKSRPTREP